MSIIEIHQLFWFRKTYVTSCPVVLVIPSCPVCSPDSSWGVPVFTNFWLCRDISFHIKLFCYWKPFLVSPSRDVLNSHVSLPWLFWKLLFVLNLHVFFWSWTGSPCGVTLLLPSLRPVRSCLLKIYFVVFLSTFTLFLDVFLIVSYLISLICVFPKKLYVFRTVYPCFLLNVG